MKKRLIAILLAAVLALSLCSCKKDAGEKIKFGDFTGNFSPFFAYRPNDLSVVDMVSEALLTTVEDKGNIVGEAYSEGVGIMDLYLDYVDNKLIYNIKLGEDIYFSDGEQMTVDDIIFSMYVFADPTYEGWSDFCNSNIQGLKNYRYNNAYAEVIEVTEEQVNAVMTEMPEELREAINENVIGKYLESEYKWVCSVYNDKAYIGTELEQIAEQYNDPKAMFAYLYSIDKNYDATKAKDEYQLIEDIKNQYGHDYVTFGNVMGYDMSSVVYALAEDVALRRELETMESPDITYITGIVKKSDFEMSVTVNSSEQDNTLMTLGVYVAPLHYYGDESQYDYNQHKFGFKKGELDPIHEKDSKPMGAGVYVMDSYKKGKSVSFSKNPEYFRDFDFEDKVTFVATGNSNESHTHQYYVTPEYAFYALTESDYEIG